MVNRLGCVKLGVAKQMLLQLQDTTALVPDSVIVRQPLITAAEADVVVGKSASFLDASWTIADHSISVGDVLIFVTILVLTQIIVWAAKFVINKAFRKQSAAVEGKKYTLKKLMVYMLYTIGVVVALDTIGIDITILVAGSAALLVGFGLGIQHIFDDLVSGFIVLFEGVIKVGDIIELDGLVARVDKIDIRTSKVITRDGNFLIIPNSKITSQNVMNWSMETRASRFAIDVGVAYGSDTQLVKRILLECAEKHPAVLNDQANRVDFISFGDSSLQFKLYFWARRSWDIGIYLSDIRFSIDEAFRENGIKIPFPQRELHMSGDAKSPKR